jgi:hypothetical protein
MMLKDEVEGEEGREEAVVAYFDISPHDLLVGFDHNLEKP